MGDRAVCTDSQESDHVLRLRWWLGSFDQGTPPNPRDAAALLVVQIAEVLSVCWARRNSGENVRR